MLSNRQRILATKTINMIDEMVKADQGASFRGWLEKVILHVGDAYDTKKNNFRTHLGASLIGRECARDIWYGFRWAVKPNHEGRMIRLFNRGHLEEARFIALLLMIGCQIYQQDANGKQYRISHVDGHMGGSGDGVAIGVPDLPENTACLTEFKTHNDTSFTKLSNEGLRESKFEHYVQMNIYMYKMGLAVGLYLAVNKDTDALYGEIVPLDKSIAEQFLERADNIIHMTTPPDKINKSPGFWKCRYCDKKTVCHLKGKPEFNCRTCIYGTIQGPNWVCMKGEPQILDKEAQLVGCDKYIAREM